LKQEGAQRKKQAPPAPGKAPAAPAPEKEPAAEAASAKKRRRPKKNRASSLSEVIQTDSAGSGEEKREYPDFSRPDPLAGNVIMDATARLLAPRPRAAAPEKATDRRHGQSGKHTQKREGDLRKQHPAEHKEKAVSAPREHRAPEHKEKAAGAPREPRGRKRRSPPPVELRKSSQKDSTEQPSLMKPYYLKRD
jgi:ATP-dependent RNA helicase RhlE